MLNSLTSIAMVATFIIAIVVFFKTRSAGKVIGVIIGGALIVAISSAGFMQSLGSTVGSVFTRIISQIGTIIG